MAANLIRFVTWQHLLLLPLMLLGAVCRWPRWQGHGWGYRYLHPVLGNACLLAGYGWCHAEARGVDLRKIMLWTTALSMFVLLPLRCVTGSATSEQQAVPERAMAQLDADVAVIDATQFTPKLVICKDRRIAFVDAPHLYRRFLT